MWGLSSPARDQTCTPCKGAESYPLYCWRSPKRRLLQWGAGWMGPGKERVVLEEEEEKTLCIKGVPAQIWE